MEEERKITPEERLWLINEVMNAECFNDLLEIIENKLTLNNSRDANQVATDDISQKTENNENKEVSGNNTLVTTDDKTYNYVEDSGMYEKDALHLVAAEFGSNLNGKALNIDALVETASNQDVSIESSNPEQTPKQEIIENNTTRNQESENEKLLTKIKESENNNPWSSARTVLPGEIKL